MSRIRHYIELLVSITRSNTRICKRGGFQYSSEGNEMDAVTSAADVGEFAVVLSP